MNETSSSRRPERPAFASLAALARKYEMACALGSKQEPAVVARPRLKRLAVEFPGALRELDRTPLVELRRRARRLNELAAGAAFEQPDHWVYWVLAYHERARSLLDERMRARSSGEGRRPGPRRGLNDQIFEELVGRFGVERSRLERAIFEGVQDGRSR